VPDELNDDARGRIRLPAIVRSPVWELSRRLILAFALLGFTVALVWFDRHGYHDANDPTGYVSLVDSIYYTTVTLSTTGYGDIAPVSERARLINSFLVTPLRIAFLVLLIGTTIEVLATQGRELLRVARWRKHMDQHIVVIGYGTKGRSAVDTLLNNGLDKEAIVVVDPSAIALGEAHADGLAVVTGDATRREVLRRAGVARATPARRRMSRRVASPTTTTRSSALASSMAAWLVSTTTIPSRSWPLLMSVSTALRPLVP